MSEFELFETLIVNAPREELVSGSEAASSDEINPLQLPVDWMTVRLAWCSAEELRWVADLATTTEDQTVTQGLAALARGPSTDTSFWTIVCALLSDRLDTLPRDPVDGPAELTAFWSELGPPDGHPHVLQGVGNSMSPADYYSVPNLEHLMSTQQRWLSTKVEELINALTPTLSRREREIG